MPKDVQCPDGPFLLMVSDGSKAEVVRDSMGNLMLTLDYVRKAIQEMKKEDCTLSPEYYHSILVNGVDTCTGKPFFDYIISVQNKDGSAKVRSSNDMLKNTINIPETIATPSEILHQSSDKSFELDVTGTFKIPKVPPKRLKQIDNLQRFPIRNTRNHKEEKLIEKENTKTSLSKEIRGRRKSALPMKILNVETSSNVIKQSNGDMSKDFDFKQKLFQDKEINLACTVMYQNRRKMAVPVKRITSPTENTTPTYEGVKSEEKLHFMHACGLRQVKALHKAKYPTFGRPQHRNSYRFKPRNDAAGKRHDFSTSRCNGRVKSPILMPPLLKLRSSILRKLGKSTKIQRRLRVPENKDVQSANTFISTSVLAEHVNTKDVVQYPDETVDMIGPSNLLIPYESGLDMDAAEETSGEERHITLSTQHQKTSDDQESSMNKVPASNNSFVDNVDPTHSSTSKTSEDSKSTLLVSN